MEKFKDKYRILSNRMPGWDYSGYGIYFITICVNGRQCILGKIKNGEMVLNDFGKIANDEWKKSTQIRREIELDEFQVMPNHLHGIVIIKNPRQAQTDPPQPEKLHRKPKSLSSFIAGYKSSVTTKINEIIIVNHIKTHKTSNIDGIHGAHDTPGTHGTHDMHDMHDMHVETHGRASLRGANNIRGANNTRGPNVARGVIPKLYTRNNRLWQLNYNDRVIRNNAEMNRIRQYIKNNPANWKKDEHNPDERNHKYIS